MNSRLFDQVEIVFWDTTIPVMTRIRSIQANLYRAHIPHEVIVQLVWQSFVWSLVGLALGTFLGLFGFSPF